MSNQAPCRNPARLAWIMHRRALNAHARAMGFINARVWDNEGEGE